MIQCDHCKLLTHDIDGYCEHCGRPLHMKKPDPPKPQPIKPTPPKIKRQRFEMPAMDDLLKDPKKLIIIAVSAAAVMIFLLYTVINLSSNTSTGTGNTIAEKPKEETAATDTGSEQVVEPEEEAAKQTTAEQIQQEASVDKLTEGLNNSSSYQAYYPFDGSDRLSFVTLNTNTYSYTGVNPKEPMSASALISIPILYTVAAKADAGDFSLSDTIKFRYTVGGRGKLTKDNDGESISLLDLARYMMLYSDNNATNSLIDYLGKKTIADTCLSYGYNSVSVGGRIMETEDFTSNDNYVSAADITSMLADLYNDKFNSIGKRFLLDYMEIQDGTGREGLGKSISGATFLNMNGLKEKKYNEIAIVDDGENPYINVVFSSGEPFETLQNYAAEYGRIVDSVVQAIN